MQGKENADGSWGVDTEGELNTPLRIIKYTLWVRHQEGLHMEGYERKPDECGKGSVLAQSTKQKSSKRPEMVSPGTRVCLFRLHSALLSPYFLLLKENRSKITRNPDLLYTKRSFPMPTCC